jgi:hypothetical protein
MRTRALLTIFVLWTLAPVALAKGPKDVHDWRNLYDLDPDKQVVVTLKTGGKLVGFPSRIADDAITIDVETQSAVATGGRIGFSRKILRDEVREVRKAKGSRIVSAATGAAIGAGVGAGLGAIGESRARSDEDKGLLITVTTFLGATIGGAVGAHNPFKGIKVYVAP